MSRTTEATLKPTIIFFDLDGTLADSMPRLNDYIVNWLHHDFGVEEATVRARLPELFAMPARQMFAETMAMAGIDLNAMPEAEAGDLVERYIGAAAVIPIEPFEEVSEVLERLQQAGMMLFITTNAPQSSLEERLIEANLHHHFRRVFGTGGGVFKGSAHIAMAAVELGMSIEEMSPRAVLVGDTEADIRIAQEAGMTAIGRLTGDNGDRLAAAGAAHLVRDLRELEALLDRL